jgi:hypothetical protein
MNQKSYGNLGSRHTMYVKYLKTHARLESGNETFSRNKGHAIAQAVNCWLPTAAARVRTRFWSSGICGGQSGAGARFLRVLRFPLPIFIPPIDPQSPSPVIWGWYSRPEVAAVQDSNFGASKISSCSRPLLVQERLFSPSSKLPRSVELLY